MFLLLFRSLFISSDYAKKGNINMKIANVLKALLIVCLLIVLNGCWDYKDINHRSTGNYGHFKT